MQPVPSYLAQNTFGVYYFRIAVPHELRHIIGKRELRQSLRTKNRKDAMSAARRMAVAAENFFRGERMTQDELDRLLRISTEIKIKGLNWHPDGKLSIESLEMDPDKEESETRMLDSLVGKMTNIPSGFPNKRNVREELTGMSLSRLISEYVQNQIDSNKWADKTLDENRAIFAILIRTLGDVPIKSITSQTARDFRSKIMRLPTNLNKLPKWKDKPIVEIIKKKHKQPLSESSVNKYLRRVSAMFEWAVDEGHAERNGFKKKQIQESKSPNERRDALTSEDIAAIFSSDTFHAEACQQSYRYWCPLLGLYTGGRLNELASLLKTDVLKENGVWCLRVKTLKQKSERYRLVPVHSRLIDLGFIEYALRQKSSLFPELHERRDGKGMIVSKWYNRYRRSVGLTETRNKDFHSFRHTVATELAKKGVPTATVSQILGHSAASGRRATTTEEVYIKPQEVEVLKEAIERLDFSDALAGVKPYSEVMTSR